VPRARRRLRRRLVTLSVVVALVAAGLYVRRALVTTRETGCLATVGTASYPLDLTQAANAATIASVGRRRGLPDHAITIALATALQESKLHNLPYGDRDSVGLFQQRPSQGWGTRQELLDPHYSAGAFFTHLVKVPAWQSLPVAQAAQAVQRSADGSAYASWEPASRLMAQALTGQVARGLACTFTRPASSAHGLQQAIAAEPGASTIGAPVTAGTGWAAASWLVAQAAQYGIGSVSFQEWTWEHGKQAWTRRTTSSPIVSYALLTPAPSP
jgi:hypothetical protein